MEIISLINQKGGVGKSTTAHALGAGLCQKGYRVLFMDLDPQGNLSYALNLDTINIQNMYSLLMDNSKNISMTQAIQETTCGMAIASSLKLSGADNLLTDTGKEYRLKECIAEAHCETNFDYIILDTPPSLGILTINALTAATKIIIPTQADIFSLQGIGQLYNTISIVKRYTNPGLTIEGILLIRYSARSILARDISELIEETARKLETKVFDSRIRESVAVKEAQAKRQDIFTYAPNSNPCIDFTEFINEFLGGK